MQLTYDQMETTSYSRVSERSILFLTDLGVVGVISLLEQAFGNLQSRNLTHSNV